MKPQTKNPKQTKAHLVTPLSFGEGLGVRRLGKTYDRELNRIRKAFFTEKGLDGYDYPDYLFRNEYGEKTTEIPKPYSVIFDMSERI